MREFWNVCRIFFAAVGGWLGYFIGSCNGLVIALIVLVICDYITGVLCGYFDKKLNSETGFKGVAKKIVIFVLVGVANVIDVFVLKQDGVIRTTVIFFYIANEGLSIVENAGHLGLPVPKKLKEVLEQLHDKER